MPETFNIYHINRLHKYSSRPLLQLSERFAVGQETNSFSLKADAARARFTLHLTKALRCSVGQPIPPWVQSMSREAEFLPKLEVLEANLKSEPSGLPDLLQHALRHATELVAETVRSSICPHLPSRRTCLWAVLSESEAEVRLNQLRPTGPFRVLLLHARGRLHTGAEQHLLGPHSSIEHLRNACARYWGGVEGTLSETLFVGDAQVIKILYSGEGA